MRTRCLFLALALGACTVPEKIAPVVDGGDDDAPDGGTPGALDTTIDDAPDAFSPDGDAAFAFSSNHPGATFVCVVDTDAPSPCTSPTTFTLADGPHTFAVAAVDGGEQDATPASSAWIIDTVVPDTTIDTAPAAVDNSVHVAIAFHADEPDADFQCALDGGTLAACTSPFEVDVGDGAHNFQVRAVDRAGNADASPAHASWSVDTSTPDTTITDGPQGPVASAMATFTFSSPDAGTGATFTCSVDGGAFAACTSPLVLSGLAEGDHALAVRVTDAGGNSDPTPATAAWRVDLTAPDTSLSGGPSGAVASTSAAFTLSADEQSSFECSLDGAPFAACTASPLLTGLAQGSHTFAARAVDLADNADASPASRTWTVDTVVPDTSIAGPSGVVASTSASFTLSSSETGVTYQCSLDGALFASCSATPTFTSLAQGAHQLDARAVDAAGNVDPAPASRTWSVDTVAPNTGLTGPAALTNSASATFDLSSDDPAATFECNLDGGAYAACSDPNTITVTAGAHVRGARAVDAAGNADPSPATLSWTVDLTAPDTTITAGPSGAVASTSASFSFSSADGTATFQCSVDGAAYAGCASPLSIPSVTQGAHTFAVRAVDPAGNTDASPATRSWTADTVAPDTSIVTGPSGTQTTTTAAFTFGADETGATFQCRTDGAAYATCATSISLTGLAQGSHTLDVRAVDAAGNTDPTPAGRTWYVDSIGPTVTITSAPSGTSGAVGTVSFTTSEGGTTCSIDGGAYVGCSSPYTMTLAAGAHTFVVQAFDIAGNRGSDTRSWTVACSQPTTGPGAYAFFHMDEGSGQTLLEALSAPDAVLGTSSLAETVDPTRIAAARYGGGLRFTGSGDTADTVTWNSNLTTHDLTVELWVKSVDNGLFDLLVGSTRFQVYSYAANGTVSYHFAVKGDDNVMAGIQAPDVAVGVWHHIVGTYAGTTLSIYVDGVLGATYTGVTNAAPYSVGSVRIAADSFNSPVDADVDELFVGTQAFTIGDVQARYCPAP